MLSVVSIIPSLRILSGLSKMSSLSTYLAKNYLTASTRSPSDLSTRPKKRRKKDKHASDSNLGLTIADDDEALILSKHLQAENDEDAPTFDTNTHSAEFRQAKQNNWKTIVAPPPIDANQAAADRILLEAVKESDVRRNQMEGDDAPAIAGETEATEAQPPKAKGGLQTAEDSARLEAAAQARRAVDTKVSKGLRKAEAEETVYRDATGRRIDISMKRAEARAAEQEKLRQERREKEEAMGEVQRREKEERKQAVEEAKFLGVARYADDEGMNEEMKGLGRWGDPMAGYVSEKKTAVAAEGTSGRDERGEEMPTTTMGRAPRKKEYQGAAMPNRYGIRPGWRWDGVDRGNGFEKEWFQARGRKSRNENLEYQWQMDE
jgi:pre-mRNA-splicing factor CWC26